MGTVMLLCRLLFHLIGIHRTKVLSILCSDFRFFKGVLKLYRQLDIGWPDEIKVPGGPMWVVKRERLILKWVRLLCSKHGIEEIYLISHGGTCGAYAEEGSIFDNADDEQAFHEDQLRQAKEVILEMLPVVKVRLIYARFDEKGRHVEFIEVN